MGLVQRTDLPAATSAPAAIACYARVPCLWRVRGAGTRPLSRKVTSARVFPCLADPCQCHPRQATFHTVVMTRHHSGRIVEGANGQSDVAAPVVGQRQGRTATSAMATDSNRGGTKDGRRLALPSDCLCAQTKPAWRSPSQSSGGTCRNGNGGRREGLQRPASEPPRTGSRQQARDLRKSRPASHANE